MGLYQRVKKEWFVNCWNLYMVSSKHLSSGIKSSTELWRLHRHRSATSGKASRIAGNGATGASGTGPALGYTLNIFWFNFLFMLISKNNMNTCKYLIHILSLIYAMKLLVIFGIKIYRKLPSDLTMTWLKWFTPCESYITNYLDQSKDCINHQALLPNRDEVLSYGFVHSWR